MESRQRAFIIALVLSRTVMLPARGTRARGKQLPALADVNDSSPCPQCPRADLSNRVKERRVAVAFVGQFSRHFTMERHLLDIFGPSGDAPSFDAFICSSTQHTEENRTDTVDGAVLCEGQPFQLESNHLFPVRSR